MPLGRATQPALDSDVADLKNDPDAWAQAGSITAALFLKRFAPADAWAHFDIFGWNPRGRPGWPVGARGAGDPRALRDDRDALRPWMIRESPCRDRTWRRPTARAWSGAAFVRNHANASVSPLRSPSAATRAGRDGEQIDQLLLGESFIGAALERTGSPGASPREAATSGGPIEAALSSEAVDADPPGIASCAPSSWPNPRCGRRSAPP